MKLSNRGILIIIIIFFLPLLCNGQEQSKKVRQAQKKTEQVEKRQIKQHEKAQKASAKQKFKIQDKETQKRIKDSQKQAKKANKTKKDFFLFRPFKKRKAKKRK